MQQIKIGLPQKDEIENLLNYLRFENNLNTFNEGKYEKLKTKLLQKRIDLKDIKKIKIEELINETVPTNIRLKNPLNT